MKTPHFKTGLGKFLLYLRIIIHVPLYYARRPRHFASPLAYCRFLRRALQLLLVFRHNKPVRVFNGYKPHLYLPAYPSPAFFYAIESKLLKTPPGPTTIVYSMTKACSYDCEHCYQKNDPAVDIGEESMIQTALQVRDAGVAMFDIEGGEPFIRYPRLLKLVQALDARTEIWINTTGAHIKPGMLEELKAAGLFGLMVSIHSANPSVHDRFTRKEGSFDIACDTLRACRHLNLVATCNSVLSEDEIRQGGMDRLMDFMRELDCDYVQLIHPKPSGAWLGRETDMQTENDLVARIQAEHLRYNNSRMHDYPSLAAQVFEEQRHVLGCTAGGVDRFYIGASGEVQPCEFLNISFGNVNEEPFAVIFDRMRSYFDIPCADWLCCTQAPAIHKLFTEHQLERTPLPWHITQELLKDWKRGKPTTLYEKLGIYP